MGIENTGKQTSSLCFQQSKIRKCKKEGNHDEKVEWIRTTEKLKEIPTIAFNSDVFECPNCHNTEYRLVPSWQNKSDTPCSACGYSPMYRVQ